MKRRRQLGTAARARVGRGGRRATGRPAADVRRWAEITQEVLARAGDRCEACGERTRLVYGYGRIGAVVAGYGRAFGMRVVVWGRETTRDKARADGYAAAASREAFFEDSDVVSLHVRLIDATRGMVTAVDLLPG